MSNVQSLQGSGPGGRVIAQDVTGATPVVAATAPAPVYVPGKCKMELQLAVVYWLMIKTACIKVDRVDFVF